ncbi:TetR/AcrR family transcriptional regulator [Nesterenkonia natronophila]|uniref:TetR/AcrR family transcriptional regulator n=1 Tax=Nesterenkonia natronophila TaxID=2174932 RepID=A0A3A4F2G9_9MICC|nr:TetR/AcrR family transcriptional regulator [Nesterenkonia natronophila]RJN32036.1 TetR/AcrR family transcriptional regulator [Nesterenkonia natronophila]
MALTAGQIVQAAHRLVAQYGVQDVSMRRVAGELGVQPGALYYHVPNKQEMLRQVAHRVLEPLREVSGEPLDLMQGLRRLILELPDGGDLILIAYSLDPELPPVPALCAALQSQGQDSRQASDGAGVLMRYALGALAVEQNARLFGRLDDETNRVYEQGLIALLDAEVKKVTHG